ncbi:MAG: adenylosuccinate lyase [Bacteroidetes bacterium]|nr:MAG: adenylosuccinate lyase [Bacteroidota bacterium]
MIPRYTRPEMGELFTDEHRYGIWLEIELLACEAQAELGVIPAETVRTIREKAAFDTARIAEIEAEVRHDVIAFLTSVGEHVGPDARFIHLGMTSSDVVDTALSVQMKQAGEILLKDLEGLKEVLGRRAKEFKHTVMIGRSHGIHAEPTTFGLKLALWYDETRRNIARMKNAVAAISVGQISGAVGTFAHLSPSVEEHVCRRLGLTPAPVSTQVIQRDRHAEYLTTLAVIGSSLDKFATEVRHLQRTEVLEAEEYFSPGQKGSSAMPHKRNPITCEQISGLARVLRGNAQAALENVALWHERDISHSSVERIIVPDSCIVLDHMLTKFTGIIDRLLVYPETMRKNLEITHGLLYSQPVLLALTKKGMKREEAYRIVQKHAMAVWQNKLSFKEVLRTDAAVTAVLSDRDLDDAFDPARSLAHVDHIFTRVGL